MKFIWQFMINEKKHTVELVVSVMTGKRKLILNAKVLFEE